MKENLFCFVNRNQKMQGVNMKYYGDYHTHTKASDGKATVAENAKSAKQAELTEFAVTDHGFQSVVCHLTEEKFLKQSEEISALNSKREVHILHGAEGSLLNANGEIDIPDDIIRRCDVLHVGFHRLLVPCRVFAEPKYILVNGFMPKAVRKKMIEFNTECYLKAMETYPIDVLVHLNHRALVDTTKVCRVAASKGIYVELNEKHLDVFEDCIDEAIESGVNFIVGTDAHKKGRVGKFDRVSAFIEKHNIPKERIFGLDRPPTFKDKSKFRV